MSQKGLSAQTIEDGGSIQEAWRFLIIIILQHNVTLYLTMWIFISQYYNMSSHIIIFVKYNNNNNNIFFFFCS